MRLRRCGPLTGRHVVVSAGGTREPIDLVRFLGNRSSGRQGVAVAGAAVRLGARVTVVSANIDDQVLEPLRHRGPGEVDIVAVGTALELSDAVRAAAGDADAVVMAAAVADYRPAAVAASKLRKHELDAAGVGGPPRIELVENPDVLAGLAADPPRRDGGRTLLVGFAAETGDEAEVLAHGRAKARRKGADLLAVNAVGHDVGFGDVPNSLVILDSEGGELARARGTKEEVASVLMNLVVERLVPPPRAVPDATTGP